MDFQQLRYFAAAARGQHLGRAATQLGISEPALSRSIARLEKHYGNLFDRTGRGVRLNACGEILLAYVERALAELENAEHAIADERSSDGVAIVLGFVPSLGAAIVPDLATRFRRLHPNARFTFMQARRTQLHAELLRGGVDLFLGSHRFDDANISWRPLWDEELVVVVPLTHRLARRRAVDFRDFCDDPMLAFQPGHQLRELVDELARRENFTPKIVFEGEDAQTMLALAGAGFGVTLLPEGMDAGGRTVALRLRSKSSRTVGVSWRNDRYASAAVLSFMEFMTRQSAKRSSPSAGRTRQG